MKARVFVRTQGTFRRSNLPAAFFGTVRVQGERAQTYIKHWVPTLGAQAGIERRQDLIKRVMDLLGSVILILFLLPLMGLVALVIRLESPGPVFFRQKRVGRGGRPFTIFKFRTMCVGAEEEQQRVSHLNERVGPVFKVQRDPRHTRVGRWVRRMSIDELPNLINVVNGEMSLVGPRPPLPSEVECYQEWHKRRLDAMPGMTGLWQVSGRGDLSFDEQCKLDLYYIEHWSPRLDLQILLQTIPAVLLARGAY